MSVTTVPIPPTPRATLFKLWGGVAAVALLAGGLAWWGTADAVGGGCGPTAFLPAGGAVMSPVTLASGLSVQTVKPGQGAKPTDADVVLVNYKGRLPDGTDFDQGERVPFPVEGLVPGFSEGLKQMQRGGSYRLCIPPALGYGAKGAGDKIPANATLIFEVDLLEFKSMAEVQAMQQMMQQQGGGAPGAPGAQGGGDPHGGAPHGEMAPGAGK